MKDFSKRILEIRKNARENLEEGAITPSYKANKEYVVKILNEALATELVCVLRYKFHYEASKGIHKIGVAEEFLEHSIQEQAHADWLASRISQLGGEPNYDPKGLAERSHTDYVEGETLKEMITEDLVAERIVIGIYQEFIAYLGASDPTTRRMLEKILEEEEDHANELSDLLFSMESEEKKEEEKAPKEKERAYSNGSNKQGRGQTRALLV